MILYNALPDDAIVVADRVRETISEAPIQFEDQTFHVTMSFGIATVHPDDAIDREGLLNRADKALYQAKSGGRNCCRIFQSAPSGMTVNYPFQPLDADVACLIFACKYLRRTGKAMTRRPNEKWKTLASDAGDHDDRGHVPAVRRNTCFRPAR